MENVRSIALDALMEAEGSNGGYGNLITIVQNKYDYLDRRDKAFIKLLFEGTTERRITLDFILDRKSSVKTAKMKPVIRNILRMGVYQILFTDAPGYAVVKESVNLAGKRGFKGLGGFVNGVLRGILREVEASETKDNNRYEIFLPKPGEFSNETFLAIKYSLPPEIAKIFTDEYGERAEKILSAMNGIRGVSLRFRSGLSDKEREEAVNKIKETDVILKQNPEISFIYQAFHTGDIRSLPGYDEGLFNVQDVSSCKAVLAAGIKEGDKVLDCCAAPGGKTILASELAKNSGCVTSCDISESKTDIIKENIDRLKCDNVEVLVRDASVHHPESDEGYDVVILDVPCSGLGVIGKKRDIKYNLTKEGLDSLIGLQRKIIDACVQYVKKGGTLLYSTCTVRRAENEEQVLYITDNYDYEIVGDPVQLLPDEAEQDGFFYCVLRRKP
ncbi:MAG: 16S rRNA (cytosine(967)-C(5))-methyltransferase RsmB [Lachnospiraceae bacterium]|nr:16S rRNA (cytosine(967)-C(5))-methyltransferase RsmB [Lachnospiraceae bacterium]